MKFKHGSIGLTLGLATALSLSACGGNTAAPADEDAMSSSGEANDAMMTSGGDAMAGDNGMVMGDGAGTDNAMASELMSPDDAMAAGGNDAMAADAPNH